MKRHDKKFSSVRNKLIMILGLSVPVVLFSVASCMAQTTKPEIISTQKIWDKAPHNAFTDLVRFKGMWYCAFREATKHVYGTDGKIRVIASRDGAKWDSVALFERKGVDLRDPKLCITPDNRLMLHIGGSIYVNQKHMGFKHTVIFSKDGKHWTKMQDININNRWPWRPAWHNNMVYSVAYDSTAALYRSKNGWDYERVCNFALAGFPNEASLFFLPGDTMVVLIRRDRGNRHACIGKSVPPYTTWTWKETGWSIGGPDLIDVSGQLYGAGRCNMNDEAKTVLGKIDVNGFTPILTLPSGGDCSYPGMVYYKKILWISYYSSHDGKTSVYLSKIKLN